MQSGARKWRQPLSCEHLKRSPRFWRIAGRDSRISSVPKSYTLSRRSRGPRRGKFSVLLWRLQLPVNNSRAMRQRAMSTDATSRRIRRFPEASNRDTLVTSILRAFPVSPLLPVSWIALNQLFHALGEYLDRSLYELLAIQRTIHSKGFLDYHTILKHPRPDHVCRNQ